MSQNYEMTLNLNILNHLGINLYSNVPAVLSEVIANAWDADADNVYIEIKEHNEEIVITDDGNGMTVKDANEKFLMVGYARREHFNGLSEKHKRPVMGRKGIGKLSLFSIAEIIQVFSIRSGEKHGFEMNLCNVKKCIENKESTYNPAKLDHFPQDLTCGTRIIISSLRKSFKQTAKHLKRRLARRFSFTGSGHEFNIYINNELVQATDRDYFHKVEFLWTYDDQNNYYRQQCKNCKHSEPRDFHTYQNQFPVRGWIATCEKSGTLNDSETGDNLNRIVILVRNKVAQEDILIQFNESGVYSSFLFGEIHADFLDEDGKEDIATSSRQQIREDDERYMELKDFIKRELKSIQGKWTQLRNDSGTEKAIEIPAVKDWYNNLGSDSKKKAKSLFGKINRLTIDSPKDRKSLLKHAILAFENLSIKENLDTLDSLEGSSFQEFIEIFKNIDDIEATWYRQIVMSRIEVIESLQKKVNDNEKEKILQTHLYTHLWLLDPSWERADSNAFMEKRVTDEFEMINANLSEEEKKGRVDIKYKTYAGKHVIIELKRAGRAISSYDMERQVDKYKKALRKILDNSGKTQEPIEIVCIIGKQLTNWQSAEERDEGERSLAVKNIRVVFYNELIDQASKGYNAFLEKNKEGNRIFKLIQEIDDSDNSS